MTADAAAGLSHRYLAALLEGDEPAASAVVGAALTAGLNLAGVVSAVVARAMEDVGRLWERAELSIAEEHMASEITASVLHQHAPFGRPGDRGDSAVVACAGGERHVLGARALAGLLNDRGWTVAYVGAEAPPAGLAALVAARRPALLALSVTMPESLGAARKAIAAIAALRVRPAVLLGGHAVGELRVDLGADFVAQDIVEGLAFISRLEV